MIDHLIDFVEYMIFSSLEYFSLFLLILSLFNMYPKYHKKELFYLTLLSTLVSYIFVMTEVYSVLNPLFINIILVWILMFVLLKQKKALMFVVSAIGIIIIILVQTITVSLFLHYDFLSSLDLENSFGRKTYFVQSINSAVVIIVSLYIVLTRSGFGFTFKNGNYKNFIYVTLSLILTIGVIYYACQKLTSISVLLIILISTVLTASLILLYFSFRRDNYEYQ